MTNEVGGPDAGEERRGDAVWHKTHDKTIGPDKEGYDHCLRIAMLRAATPTRYSLLYTQYCTPVGVVAQPVSVVVRRTTAITKLKVSNRYRKYSKLRIQLIFYLGDALDACQRRGL